MSVDMTTQSIAVGDNWVKVGSDYVGNQPEGPSASVTITGTGFGTKVQAAPIKFDQFQGYSDDTTLQSNDADWEQYQTNGGALIKSDRPRYSGGKYAYNDSTRHGFATNFHTFTPTDEVFLSYWFSTDQAVYGSSSGTTGTYWVGKHSRITSSSASGGGGVYNGLGVHSLSNQNPWASSEPYLSQSNGVDAANPIEYITVPQSNTWVRIDMYAKLSDLDTANGVFNCKTWGYETFSKTDITSRKTAGGNYQLDSVILGLMHANHQYDAGGLKITDVYIDNTQQRVELTDSATYASSTISEIQPVTAWSDTSITINLNTDALSAGTYYLHVIDDSGASIYNESRSVS